MSGSTALIFLKIVLLPLSWVYGIGIVLRNLFYDVGIFHIESVSVPVISVGNITVGGTGKTPIVEWIIHYFVSKNIKVAVVSRGYKRTTKGTVVVSDGKSIISTPSESGDEPFQIARKFPAAIVVDDESRDRGAQCAIQQYGAEVIVLDDGFQHRSLHRNLDIVVVDVEQPPQKTWMLPAGARREPLSGLKRAHAVVFSRWSEEKESQVSEYIKQVTSAIQVRAVFVPKSLVRLADKASLPLDEVKGKSCLAFCGIARPETFLKMLSERGIEVKESCIFPDHYQYTHKDLHTLAQRFSENNLDIIVTTEKDAVRLLNTTAEQFQQQQPLYYMELETHILENSLFSELLDKTILRR